MCALARRQSHLYKQLFATQRHAPSARTDVVVDGIPAPASFTMRDLNERRFLSIRQGYQAPRVYSLAGDGTGGGLINVDLVWDKLPTAAPGAPPITVIGAEHAVEPTAAQLFDLKKLMQPTVDATASEARIAKNNKYMTQRAEYAPLVVPL